MDSKNRRTFVHKITLKQPKPGSHQQETIYQRLRKLFPAIYTCISQQQINHIIDQLLKENGSQAPAPQDIRALNERYGDLQKVPPEQLKKAKNDMEQGFQVNCVKPGDKEWRYDVRIDFEASEENEWDEFDEDSFHSNRKSESPRRKQNGTEEAAKTEENDTTQAPVAGTKTDNIEQQYGGNDTQLDEEQNEGDDGDEDDYSDSFEEEGDEDEDEDGEKQQTTGADHDNSTLQSGQRTVQPQQQNQGDTGEAESVPSEIENEDNLLDSDEEEDSGSVDADDFF